jgi:hypothetical protein
MATLSALVSGLEAELQRLGYKDSMLVWYRGCWRRMQKHFAARGVEEFSLDAAMAWVDDACGFFDKADLRDAGRGVRRVHRHPRRAGLLRRRHDRGVRRHADRIPVQGGSADYAQRSTSDIAVTRPCTPALRITRHCS